MKRIKSNRVYQAKFTAGGLLFKENEKAIPFLLENGLEQAHVLRENPEYLGTNSVASRIRMVREILYRYKAFDRELWEQYLLMPKKDKCLMLYMACLLTYPILRDFHFSMVLKKWKELSDNVRLADFFKFLNEVSGNHPEVDEWTDSTRTKMGTVSLRMLEEAGFIQHDKLMVPDPGEDFLSIVVYSGNAWYLEALLMTKSRRDEILKK